MKILFYLAPVLMLVACSKNADYSPKEGQKAPQSREEQRKENFGKVFGDDAFSLGGSKKSQEGTGGVAVVNQHLWRASLEAVNFIPLQSADAVGGTIITDWYTSAQSPNERLKMTIYITGTQLRSDAVRVSVFKQVKSSHGEWVASSADQKLATDIEDVILSRARQLRMAAIKDPR